MIDSKLKTLIMMEKLKSYTKVASFLGLSQPAISMQIKQLEDEYGYVIFEKSGKDLILTSQGEILLSFAKKLFTLEDEVKNELVLSTKDIKVYKIGITSNINETLLINVLILYAKQNINCRFEIVKLSMQEIYNTLSLGEINLAIIEGRNVDSSFKAFNLKSDQLKLVVNANHPLSKENSILFNEFAKFRLILPSKTNRIRTILFTYLIERGKSILDLNIEFEVENDEAIKKIISQNQLAGLLFESNCYEEIKNGTLIAIPLEGLKYERNQQIVYPRIDEIEQMVKEITTIYHELT